jgi:two-component system LytT family response regulator
MIHTLIIDDEPLARKRLRTLLAAFADVEVVAEAENGADAVLKIETHRPDLLLLDVQMPDLDGFGVLRMVELETLPLAIFVTAHDQYAVDAFEVNAVDYLLKPVRRQRLEQALTRAREKLAARGPVSAHLTEFLQAIARQPTSYLQRLPVRSHNRVLILNVDEITSLRIDRGLVYVATTAGDFWTKYTAFTELEGRLDPQVFLRVHRQVMVNLNHVREITTFDNHTARLTLTGGQQVNVSRSHLKALRQTLNW